MNIYMNSPEFEHDVQMLVMAFYPKDRLKVIINADLYKGERLLHIPENENFLSFYISNVISFEIFNKGESVHYSMEEMTLTDRKLRKDKIKRLIYRALSKYLNVELPWGTLTGIRPVKMVRSAIENGVCDSQLTEELKRDYYMSDDKINLSLLVAKTELNALKNIEYKNGYSLYAGIPFCPSRCAYCSFTSYPLNTWEKHVDEYLTKMCEEINFTVDLLGRERINTIYVGGGTPTTLTPKQLEMLLTVLKRASSESKISELTVEAGRPDSITVDKLKVLKDFGVDRISINPQTMSDDTLKRIGRRHSVAQTVEAYELARSVGFDNINMDIIVGLPGEEQKDVENTLKRIKQLSPDSLTVHSLAIKRAAYLNTHKSLFSEYESKNSANRMMLTNQYAADMGMIPYYLYRQKNMSGNFENVGYAKEDKIALYNILIMEEMQTIAAVGAGASTKLFIPNENRIERVENVKDVGVYLDRFEDMLERKRSAVMKEKGRLFNAGT